MKKKTMMTSLVVALCASAQTKPFIPPSAATGTLTGRVFLITKGGDVKPARFADVYVLPKEQAAAFHDDTVKQMQEYIVDSQSLQDQERQLKRAARLGDRSAGYILSSLPPTSLIPRACLEHLVALDPGKKRPGPNGHLPLGEALMSSTVTDEEGVFNLKLKPDTYLIVVSGQGGQNLALWIDDVTIQYGQNSMKLHDPVVACPMN
jgi:hypothetical protein